MSTPIPPAVSARHYLVISAGIKGVDGRWQQGGTLFSVALSAVEGMSAEALLAMLGVQDDTISLSGQFTIPAERINLLGLVIKWKSRVEQLTVEARIVDESALPALQAGAVSVHINL